MTENVNAVDSNQAELAGRFTRLLAQIVDGILVLIIGVPLIFLVSLGSLLIPNPAQGAPSFGASITAAIIFYAIFFALNYKLLANKGQTIGKKLLNIKIVSQDGGKIEIKELILKRYMPFYFVGLIPYIKIISLLDVLMIFRKSRYCLHDDLAKSKVVKA